MPTTWPRRCFALVYLVAVVTLASISWSHDPNGFSVVEAAAFALTIPTVIFALPVIYGVGALAFHLTGATGGGPQWPVAVTFAVMFGVCACLNVWLLHAVVAVARKPRDPRLATTLTSLPSVEA